MYRNLLKRMDYDGKYNETLSSSLLSTAEYISGSEKIASQRNIVDVYSNKLPDRENSKDETPELSVRMFFEFMRTAYQVNDSFEELTSILAANSEIDWTELARIDVNLRATEKDVDKKCSGMDLMTNNRIDKSIGTSEEQIDSVEIINSDVPNNFNLDSTEELQLCQPSIFSNNTDDSANQNEITEPIEHSNVATNPNTTQESQSTEKKPETPKNSKNPKNPSFETSSETSERPLGKCMKKNLSDVLHEGLLDSVLPYMLPKPAHSQPIIKKSILTSVGPKKSASLGNNLDGQTSTVSSVARDKDKKKLQRQFAESEVEIHVCDEAKNLKKDFRCPQKLLVQKMCYFAEVTAGQKLDEMDISVHCDIVIFDWLMRWVKKDIIRKSEWPILEASNVIPIMVSASFLQMEPLLEQCLVFCHENMSEVLKTSTILTCLNDNIFTRLADLFTNADVECLKDKKDKIQSRLFCKLTVALVDSVPDNARGHYSSLENLYKCGKCGKLVIRHIADSVPCVPSAMRLDAKGNIHSKHVRDQTWNLNEYIVSLRSELRSGRKVYWRLWGDCHFLYCRQCEIFFPINQMDWCSYHPEIPQFFANEQHRNSPFPLGRYPCCSQRAYRFEALPNKEGCRFKEHIPGTISGNEADILTIFATYRDAIAIDPPQLFFPENITRLVARDPSLQPGKLSCKDAMWWDGVELVPPRSKLGLLGKIWADSGIRRSCQVADTQRSKKSRLRTLQVTEASTPCSSMTASDEDDPATGCGNSSVDEDSDNSEESRAWPSCNRTPKIKTNSRYYAPKRNDGGRCWTADLVIRYNQDNQRDFEEKAGAQMVALLTKRTAIERESNLFAKNGKQYPHSSSHQPIGGTYVKLEAEFREQSPHSHKCKTAMHLKGSSRVKSSKIS